LHATGSIWWVGINLNELEIAARFEKCKCLSVVCVRLTRAEQVCERLKGAACRRSTRTTTTTDAFCHTPRSLFRTQILISSLASLSCKTASRLFLPYFLRHAIVKKQTHHTNTHSGPCVSPFLSEKAPCSNVRAKAHAATYKSYTPLCYFQFAAKNMTRFLVEKRKHF
jgi:hypothetical protein